MANGKKECWEKITILVHTKNRPLFLLRLINYYNDRIGNFKVNLIILDSSSNQNFHIIYDEIERNNYSLNIKILHHHSDSSFYYRMSEAFPLILTPYVLLAADDDFYFIDWVGTAVDLLDSDPSYGTVYGHTIFFELEHYSHCGNLVRFEFSRPNPPARWLEGDTPSERLIELGKSEWTTIGWYALQRAEILSIIINNAKEYKFDGYHFEKLLVFCQAALAKTKMLDCIYLARQSCDAKRPPYSFEIEKHSIEKLKFVSASILARYKKIGMNHATEMVNDVFRADICQLKKNDSRRFARLLANSFPWLREIWYDFYRLIIEKQFQLRQFTPDERFPLPPSIDLSHPKIKEIFDLVCRSSKTTIPLVTIGLPVFNGEKEIALALDALLGQDYLNLEIIISDNASTDATPEVCRKYAQKDSRVKYYRSSENFGSVWNFNRVFELSSGTYFMWAAHDDLREKSFVSACVEKMEQCQDAVLCQAVTSVFIEGHEEKMCVVNLDSFEGVTGVANQYQETLKHFPATALYGLYRSSAMHKTKMFQRSIATDMAFVQELSIQGRFVQIPQMLFTYYGREKWNTVQQDYRVFFGNGRKPWWYLPFVALFCNHWRRVARASIPFAMKLRLWGILIAHETGQLMLKILIKTTGMLCPERWKENIGQVIYWQWMHNPNVRVVCASLFSERIIRPRLHWWDSR